jgi:hypothetical protein
MIASAYIHRCGARPSAMFCCEALDAAGIDPAALVFGDCPHVPMCGNVANPAQPWHSQGGPAPCP